jgi:glycosyltransferase involved in cell wall biosynthesis
MMRTVLLIPAYNAASTVEETLTSVQEQRGGLSGLGAVYLADDGSLDDTVVIARHTWHSPVPLVIYERDPNVGERANVNRAVARFRNDVDWFILLHADDLAKPSWLQSTLDAIAASEPDVASICTSWDDLLADGHVIRGEDRPALGVQRIKGTQTTVRGTLLSGCWWHISGCAIRATAFDDIGPFNPLLPQLGDWDWLLRCLVRGWVVAYIPRTLICYRQTPTSVGAVSFQSDRDIHEGLELIWKNRSYLTRQDIARLHWQRLVYAVRRAARGTLQRRWGRVATALGTASFVLTTGAARALRPY